MKIIFSSRPGMHLWFHIGLSLLPDTEGMSPFPFCPFFRKGKGGEGETTIRQPDIQVGRGEIWHALRAARLSRDRYYLSRFCCTILHTEIRISKSVAWLCTLGHYSLRLDFFKNPIGSATILIDIEPFGHNINIYLVATCIQTYKLHFFQFNDISF